MGMRKLVTDCLVRIPALAREPYFLPWSTYRRKPWWRRLGELLWLRGVDGRVCAAYNALGMDAVGRRPGDYVRNYQDIARRVWAHNAEYAPSNWTAVTCDKRLLAAYFEFCGVPHVRVLASIGHGFGAMIGQRTVSWEDLVAYLRSLREFFLKPSDDFGGHHVMRVTVREDGAFLSADEVVELRELTGDCDWVVQECLRQHPEMMKLNPTSVNTLRIITCRDAQRERFELFCPSSLRIGGKGSVVDNVCSGGLGVGIDADGRLKRFAITSGGGKTYRRYERHPDWGYAFEGIQIPYYHEAVELAIRTHRLFSRLWVIGWDIAVTESGPIFIEANAEMALEEVEVQHQLPLSARLHEIGME